MPMLLFALLYNFVRETVRVHLRNKRKDQTDSLCASCFHAHIQYGTKTRRAISCAYTGSMRAMTLDVLYCTDYQARNQPTRRRIGFVYEIASAE